MARRHRPTINRSDHHRRLVATAAQQQQQANTRARFKSRAPDAPAFGRPQWCEWAKRRPIWRRPSKYSIRLVVAANFASLVQAQKSGPRRTVQYGHFKSHSARASVQMSATKLLSRQRDWRARSICAPAVAGLSDFVPPSAFQLTGIWRRRRRVCKASQFINFAAFLIDSRRRAPIFHLRARARSNLNLRV